MKEKRKGPIGRAAELAEGVAATVRRMQREREPRVLVYDETGYARLVQPNGRGHDRLLETAEKMVSLTAAAEAAAKPRRLRRPEAEREAGATEVDEGGETNPRRPETKPRRAEGKPSRPAGKSRRSAPKPRRSEAKPRRSRRAAPEDRT
jgi:hypothetical protein